MMSVGRRQERGSERVRGWRIERNLHDTMIVYFCCRVSRGKKVENVMKMA